MKTKVYRGRRLSSNALGYLAGTLPAGLVPTAIERARQYWRWKVYRDRRGDWLFAGTECGGLCPGCWERFYLSVERPWADHGPIETVWGRM